MPEIVERNFRITVTQVQASGPSKSIEIKAGGLGIGPRGLPGNSLSVVAAEVLGGHRVVTIQGLHATPATANEIAGITTGASGIGATADVVTQGLLTEGSWTWTPGAPIFVGSAGILTQSPSTVGPMRRVAWAISPTQINVDFGPTIEQA